MNRLLGKMASEEILRPFFLYIPLHITAESRGVRMKPAPKVPCNECPFRRVAPNGYLGAATPDNFIRSTLITEVGMPCHLTVDYEDDNWLEQMETSAHLCRGSLIFLKNVCKLPRTPEYSAAVQATVADRKTVFSNPAEFLEHHTAPITLPKTRKRTKPTKKVTR